MSGVHSPAPWQRTSGTNNHLIRDALGEIIVMLPSSGPSRSRTEQLANAELLTTAPQLLRIIEMTLELHAAGSIRLPTELLSEMLALQQTARGAAAMVWWPV